MGFNYIYNYLQLLSSYKYYKPWLLWKENWPLERMFNTGIILQRIYSNSCYGCLGVTSTWFTSTVSTPTGFTSTGICNFYRQYFYRQYSKLFGRSIAFLYSLKGNIYTRSVACFFYLQAILCRNIACYLWETGITHTKFALYLIPFFNKFQALLLLIWALLL